VPIGTTEIEIRLAPLALFVVLMFLIYIVPAR
jgi:hypothetical protein